MPKNLKTEIDPYLFPPPPNPLADLFRTMQAHEWLRHGRDLPRPKMLFGEFWYEGELCILFADTNAGKSVLAVQIGNSLAGRKPIHNFGIDTPEVNVLYIDFELTATQFKQRYTHEVTGADLDFNLGFFRSGFNSMAEAPQEYPNYEAYMNAAIQYNVNQTGAKVLIIDNLSCLRGGTQNAAAALALMKNLRALKAKLQISILVLAHTPKRNPAKPITRNDLQGSKMLINFADSAFAIGESHHQPGLRYLKQVKQRATQQIYGDNNVCLCTLKKAGDHLRFEFTGNAAEREHLRPQTAYNKQQLATQITGLSTKGLSQRQISAQLGIGLGTVNRVVKKEGIR